MKRAFTLAEVLITLGIIGVVAALTLPAVIQNYQKRSLEVATKKFYSVITQAVKQYMADEGVDDLRGSSLSGSDYDSDEITLAKNDEFFKKYLNAQICEDGCFADNYKTQSGGISKSVGKSSELQYLSGRYLLPDGMVVDSYYYFSGDTYPGDLYVDVNGKKGPNKIGYDLWSMTVFYDGVIDESGLTPECRKSDNPGFDVNSFRDDRFYACRTPNSDAGNYGGCFGHFLENGFKFDY